MLEHAIELSCSVSVMHLFQRHVSHLARSKCNGSRISLEGIVELSALSGTSVLTADDESDVDWSLMAFSQSHSNSIPQLSSLALRLTGEVTEL